MIDPSEHLGLVNYAVARYLRRNLGFRGLPSDDHPFTEALTSDATIALVRAAKHFNPDLGNAFSSYAVPAMFNQLKRSRFYAGRHLSTQADAGLFWLDDSEVVASKRFAFMEDMEEWRAVSSVLSEAEAFVLTWRTKGLTLLNVGEALGVTRERVRQIQEIAVDKVMAEAKRRERIESVMGRKGRGQASPKVAVPVESRQKHPRPKRGPRFIGKRTTAISRWLTHVLSKGPVDVALILEMAQAKGFNLNTVQHVKNRRPDIQSVENGIWAIVEEAK